MRLILEAALAEFSEHGYAGASMAGTALRAGVTKGLIYHYFPAKPDLFRAVVRSCVQPVFLEAEQLVAQSSGSCAALLEALIGMAYARAVSDRREITVLRLLLQESDRFPELAELYRAEVLSRAIALVRGVLSAGVCSGEFRPEAEAEAEGMAAVLLAPAIMASIWRMMLGTGAAPETTAMHRAHVALALRGLLRQAPAARGRQGTG